MKNNLRGHFVLDNNDALLIANITIASPNLFGVEENRILVQRVNSNGDSLWSKFIGFAPNVVDSSAYCLTAQQLKNGDIILVFISTVYDNYGPIFVRLDNATGNIIWVRQHNLFIGGAGIGVYISSILEDKNGDLVCLGSLLFEGLVVKIKSTNGDMLFTKRYTQEIYTGFYKAVETESKYFLLGGTSSATYGMNLLTAIEKTDGMPSFGYGLDSSYDSPIIYENIIYENGIFKLQGNAFTYAINSPVISSYLTIDSVGNILSSRVMKSNSINKAYYPFSRGGAQNYDYANRVGVSSVTSGTQNEAHIYKLNPNLNSTIWSYIIPYPDLDLFAGVFMGRDSSLILGGNNIDSTIGTTAMLLKVLPNGKMGACPTVDFPVYFKDTVTSFKKALLSYNTFFYLSDLIPPIVSYNASGYQWQVTCNAAQTCKLSKTEGKQIVCKKDTVTYNNKFFGACSNKVNYSISGTGATIIATTDSSVQIVFNQIGNYILRATMLAQCGTLKDSILITTKVATKPIISPIQSICKGDSIMLTVTPTNYTNYLWNNNAITPQIKVADTGLYFVKVQDIDGCMDNDTMHIQQLLEKPAHFLPNDTTICKYLPIYVQPSIAFVQYIWNTGGSQIPLKINKAGQYILEVKNSVGCIGKDSIQISENGCKQWVRFPTAFTPNRDGQNDIWKAFTFGIVEHYSMQIYNRWGQVIFSSNNPLETWDGTYRGLQVPQGTYIIMSNYKLEDEPKQFYKGIIQVIR
jgi:gliding motility-associated-like protein